MLPQSPGNRALLLENLGNKSMHLIKKLSPILFASIAVLLAASATLAQQPAAAETPAVKVKIKNFGQMDSRFYRGAQPRKNDYKDLAALGITTIIDLRENTEADERPLVESLGMKYVNIPMVGKMYPTPEATEQFLKTVNDPATGKFFVHCAGGRHRTGAMGAVYRFQFYDWTFDQAYQEMKQYDFYTRWGHQAFKDFVQDYYSKTRAAKDAASKSQEK
jgi:protein tyrosine/serine phosphatase